MAELTKKKLKEAVTESLEPFVEAVQKDFGHLDTKVDLKTDKLDNRLAKVEFEVRETRQEVRGMKADVKWMKDNASELFSKLDRFIALLEKQEQETAVLAAHVRRLEERIAKLESLKK